MIAAFRSTLFRILLGLGVINICSVVAGIWAVETFIINQMNENFRLSVSSSIESVNTSIQTSNGLITAKINEAMTQLDYAKELLREKARRDEDLSNRLQDVSAAIAPVQAKVDDIAKYIGAFPTIDETIAETDSLTSINAVIVNNMAGRFSTSSGVTLFLPNNDAVRDYQDGLRTDPSRPDLFGNDRQRIVQLVENLAVSGIIFVEDIWIRAQFESLGGTRLDFSLVYPDKDKAIAQGLPTTPFYQINATLRILEIKRARNGIVYIVDGVLGAESR